MNELGLEPEILASASVLSYSLEKRAVLQIDVLKILDEKLGTRYQVLRLRIYLLQLISSMLKNAYM
uniref:Uncharacterized protein LOC104230887 n=3 Tax=Nicotiana sylvestris TaxID=4096 RepID=A0A1U7X6S9_NICSY|nr:PREDICTED: uncharacterized protein LOC104230887 [Nicotiana sylvestris]XP_009782180.1 PREDICTED: uncharacterized protein LOC104230887 [Nicotiana sylvestris]